MTEKITPFSKPTGGEIITEEITPSSRPTGGEIITEEMTPSSRPTVNVKVTKFVEAKQSSNYGYSGAVAGKAIDGKTDGNFGKKTCTHTQNSGNPWWYVDLGSPIPISKIVIYNRGDCCGNRLRDAKVRVGNNNVSPFDKGNDQCGATLSTSMIRTNPIEIVCSPPITGQYVSVYLPRREFLTLCEVELYTDRSKNV
ncbi:fucolectin-like [Antedon mediterranea]|uniref:fucolectin-like n=1 Tax=Antedon mediterranea TaxID=105859 RepID=UPI003AF9139A